MIIMSTIAALLAAPSLAISASLFVDDPQEEARIKYSNCLIDGHNLAIKAGSTVGAFEDRVKTLCVDERKTYYDIIYKSEKEFGSSDTEAKEYAQEECDQIDQSMVSAFANNLQGKQELVKS